MAKIRSNREFSARIDAAFETQKTRDEAKRRYELDRQELKDAESELCDYAACGKSAGQTGKSAGQTGKSAGQTEKSVGDSESLQVERSRLLGTQMPELVTLRP